MRTETFELVLIAARRAIADHEAGRHVDPFSLAWAKQVLAANKPKESQQ